MNLRQLRYFVAAAELEHIGKAAERLHIAQPALTRQIRDLEAHLGSPLFDRIGRGVRLNDFGQALLPDAKVILDGVRRFEEDARRRARGEVGRLRVAFLDGVSWGGIVPEALGRFRRACPQVRLDVTVMSSDEQIEALRDGRVDAGFLRNYEPTLLPGSEARAVLVENVVLALPSGHELASRDAVPLELLAGQSFVWFPRLVSPRYHDVIEAVCRGAGLSLTIVQEGGSDTAMLSLVAAGVGLTFMPEGTRWRKPDSVVLRPVPDMTHTLTLTFVTLEANHSPALARFREVVAGCAAEGGH